MFNERLFYFWIFLPFFIISVILLLILYKRHGIFRSFWQMDIPKLTGSTILMSTLTLLLLLRIFTNWAAALGTWGTLLVAFAAFWAIRNSTTQERRHRQAELDRESRDRREHLLNELIDWATNILKLNATLSNFTESVRLGISNISTKPIEDLYSDTMALRDKGKYMKITAHAACNNAIDAVIRLQDELSKIANLLNDFIERNEIVGDVSHLITTEDAMLKDTNPTQDNVEKHRKNLAELCNLIIDEAAKVKVTMLIE